MYPADLTFKIFNPNIYASPGSAMADIFRGIFTLVLIVFMISYLKLRIEDEKLLDKIMTMKTCTDVLWIVFYTIIIAIKFSFCWKDENLYLNPNG